MDFLFLPSFCTTKKKQKVSTAIVLLRIALCLIAVPSKASGTTIRQNMMTGLPLHPPKAVGCPRHEGCENEPEGDTGFYNGKKSGDLVSVGGGKSSGGTPIW